MGYPLVASHMTTSLGDICVNFLKFNYLLRKSMSYSEFSSFHFHAQPSLKILTIIFLLAWTKEIWRPSHPITKYLPVHSDISVTENRKSSMHGYSFGTKGRDLTTSYLSTMNIAVILNSRALFIQLAGLFTHFKNHASLFSPTQYHYITFYLH